MPLRAVVRVMRAALRHEPIQRRKAALAKLIRRAKAGLVLNEHIDPRLQARARRYRIEAPWLALPLRPVAALDQEQESGRARMPRLNRAAEHQKRHR
jgi:hypothetical protein